MLIIVYKRLEFSLLLQGHVKVVQFLVKEVNQFPSDIECMRYIATITDKVNLTLGKDTVSYFQGKYM